MHSTMQNKDFDVVIPAGNESGFIDMALKLGYTGLIFLTSDPRYVKPVSTNGMIIKTGYLLRDVSEISKFRQRFDYLFAPADRKFFEQKVDFILDSDVSDFKDSLHYRSTSLNQVHAELARKNSLNIVIGFNNLLASPIRTYGRMCQNAVLINKYGIDRSSFSLAVKPSLMRSRNVLDALLNILSL